MKFSQITLKECIFYAACMPEFIKSMDISVGVSSRCPYVGGSRWLSRRECFDEAIGSGGNVVNFREEECQVLKCSVIEEPGYSKANGAWDVYILQCENILTNYSIFKVLFLY